MGKVEHFDIPFNDPEKGKEFLTKAFGWKIEKVPDMDYWTIKTGGTDGGLYTRSEKEQQPAIYVTVESVDATAKNIQELGGKLLKEKTTVPGMGWFCVVSDPEGNGYGIWEEDKGAK